MASPLQKILFGSPGTGKSYKISNQILPELLRIGSENSENVIKTVFHPEYTYSDFMGKLVPLSKSGKVEYNFYPGHFLRSLAIAYRRILDVKPSSVDTIDWNQVENVALVIDEINRGNSSAIFGTCFQLLDRESNGWSSYEVNLTEIEFYEFMKLVGVRISNVDGDLKFQFPGDGHYVKFETLRERFSPLGVKTSSMAIRLPPNFSILATMNTSDNSIYFMDSAFKRRWDWEFIDWDERKVENPASYESMNEQEWFLFVCQLNKFMKSHHTSIRGIEDKQVGKYFIKERPVTEKEIKNKLMFFLWDSVFARDKRPLLSLLNSERYEGDELEKSDLVTISDFLSFHNEFVSATLKYSC
ncbi:MAG: restriction endonuclease [Oscillatoriales cyanobacterium]|nr:MAG: restriction endonuclease [Oscillatoriales cyanobacterium]